MRKLLFTGVGIVIVLLAIELGTRVMLQLAGVDPGTLIPRFVCSENSVRVLDYQAHPFLPFIFTPNRRNERQRAHHNSLGFRSKREFTFDKGDVYRILTFGGSTTWGAQGDGRTWPEQMEKILNEADSNRRFEVYNFGLNGALTPFSVVNLALHGVHYDPDLVIVYHGVNDLGALGHSSLRTDYSHYVRDFQPNASYMGFRFLAPRWMYHSQLLGYVLYQLDLAYGFVDKRGVFKQVFRRYAPQHGPGNPKDREQLYGIEVLLRNVRTMRGIAREYDAQFLGATFHFRDLDRAPINDALRAFFEAETIDYVDVEASLPHHDRSVQHDHVHFTDKGAKMLGRIMAEKALTVIAED